MKFTVLPQDLVKKINIAQKAVSSRTTMNILECIRFEAKGTQITLSATDLELSIQTSLHCEVEEEGSCAIPSSLIGNIFRKLPPKQATMYSNGEHLTIDCGESHYELQISPASDFPTLPQSEETRSTKLLNDLLRRSIRETEFATSLNEINIALTGIYFKREHSKAHFVATDGYRLAVKNLTLPEDSESFEESVIIPRRAMNELVKIIPEEGEVSIRISTGHIYFQCGDTSLISRLIDKNYLEYEQIISKDTQTTVKVDRILLQSALERASLLAKDERANLIKLDFAPSILHIESNSEIGSVNDQVPIELEGQEIKIAFNAKYLLDGIRALDCETISLSLNGPLNPMLIQPVDDKEVYLYLVLPVRVGR